MFDLVAVSTAIHALSAVIWVGGMVFAYAVLRPSLGALEPPQRLTLWRNVFERFFVLVWIIVVALPATGYVLVFRSFGGFAGAGMYVHAMHMIALVMIGLFVYLYFAPYRRFRAATAAGKWPEAAGRLNTIRRIIGVNMILGLIAVVIGASGRYWA